MLETPFVIGGEYWLSVAHPRSVIVPCPVCAGKRAVTVILGSGEAVVVECECCGLGKDSPCGTVQEWDHTPHAARFTVASIVSFYSGRWRLCSVEGEQADWTDLCPTEAEAMLVAERNVAQQQEENMQRRQYRRKGVKHATWSIAYHRKAIYDLQRQLDWHRARIRWPWEASLSCRPALSHDADRSSPECVGARLAETEGL